MDINPVEYSKNINLGKYKIVKIWTNLTLNIKNNLLRLLWKIKMSLPETYRYSLLTSLVTPLNNWSKCQIDDKKKYDKKKKVRELYLKCILLITVWLYLYKQRFSNTLINNKYFRQDSSLSHLRNMTSHNKSTLKLFQIYSFFKI